MTENKQPEGETRFEFWQSAAKKYLMLNQEKNKELLHVIFEQKKLESELKSLQAYNGKLVDALKWLEQHYMNILNSDDYANIGIEKIEQALSSFTDKTKKI